MRARNARQSPRRTLADGTAMSPPDAWPYSRHHASAWHHPAAFDGMAPRGAAGGDHEGTPAGAIAAPLDTAVTPAAPHLALPPPEPHPGLAASVDVDAFTGAAAMTVPLPIPPARGAPPLALIYAHDTPPGAFGPGMRINIPTIARRTALGIPRYDSSDVFLGPDGKELVPGSIAGPGGAWVADERIETEDARSYRVRRYLGRVNPGMVRTELWTAPDGLSFWKVRDALNGTAIYGRSPQARIADPDAPDRVLEWLLEQHVDALGNRVAYAYKAEDGASWSGWRAGRGFANKYPQSILYGNYRPAEGAAETFAFELRFDYGEHDLTAPTLDPVRAWPLRPDPRVSCRPGFALHVLRLCRNILAINHLPETPGGGLTLAAVIRLGYREDPVRTCLTAVAVAGYRRGPQGYDQASLPALSFDYAEIDPGAAVAQPITVAGGGLLPGEVDRDVRLADLRGEGLPGLVQFSSSGWRYFPPYGGGRFGDAQLMAPLPSAVGADPARCILHDVDGTRRTCVMLSTPEIGGFFAPRPDGTWAPFRPFASYAAEIASPNARWADLFGSGRKDVVVPIPDGLRVYRSQGTEGFAAPMIVPVPAGFPTLEERNEITLVTFADMLGDGLAHCVQVSDGSVEVWPNLGGGRFAAAYQMTGAPRLGSDIASNRILLGDFTGSGLADLVVVHADRVELYRNQSSNGFAPAVCLALPGGVDSLDHVIAVDLLGTGLDVLAVFKDGRGNDVFIDFCGGVFPGLLAGSRTATGARTAVTWQTSTALSLEDRARGQAWASTLPTPVAVATAIEHRDEIGGLIASDDFTYRDGCYDLVERIFRGFACVETVTRQMLADPPSGQPPAVAAPRLTRTWFHPGATDPRESFDSSRLRGSFSGDPHEVPASPDVFLLSTAAQDGETVREAMVALAGAMLRQEIFLLDDDGRPATVPLRIEDHGYQVDLMCPALAEAFASFRRLLRETVASDYEGVANDPRVTHDAALRFDAEGTPTQTVALHYPRRSAELAAQAVILATLHESDYIDVDSDGVFLSGLLWQVRHSELAGLHPANLVFSYDELAVEVATAASSRIDYGAPFGSGPQARLFAWTQTLYWNDDLSAAAAAGASGSQALLHHERQAVFPTAFAATAYGGRVTPAMLGTDAGLVQDAGYWWRAGTMVEYAADAYFLPTAFRTPFQTAAARTTVAYDQYKLLPVRVTDPLGKARTAQIDYQALQPAVITDENGVVSEAIYDALGRLSVASACATVQGDYRGGMRLGNYRSQVVPGLEALLADPGTYLQGALTFVLYLDGAWDDTGQPLAMITVEASRYPDDPKATTPAQAPRLAISYHDADGRLAELIERVERAALQNAPASGDWAWVSRFRAVRFTDGAICLSYLPAALPSPRFQPAGSRPCRVQRRDALGREAREDDPKGFFSRIDHPNAWEERYFDRDDTIRDAAYYKAHIDDPNLPPTQARALRQAATFYDTPRVLKLDPQGNVIAKERLNLESGKAVAYTSSLTVDIRGLVVAASDPRLAAAGVTNVTTVFDMLSRPIVARRADAGDIALLPDALDLPVHSWTARGEHVQTSYDQPVRRPLRVSVDDGAGACATTIYAYGTDAATLSVNRLVGISDQSGQRIITCYEIGGRPVAETWRFVAAADGSLIDWSDPAKVALAPDNWALARDIDPFGAIIAEHCPDGSVIRRERHADGSLAAARVEPLGVATPVVAAADVTYTADRQPTTARLGGAASASWSYDPLTCDLVRSLATDPAGESVLDLSYTLDPEGNVCSVEDGASTRLLQLPVTPVAKEYSFDALYRLIGATGRSRLADDTIAPYSQALSYDRSDNLISVRHSPAGSRDDLAMTVAPASNRAVAQVMTTAGKTVDGFFDAAGNLTALESGSTLTYDFAGRLVTATAAATAAAYRYDVDGCRRTRHTTAAGTTATWQCVGSTWIETVTGSGQPDQRTFHVVVREHDEDLLIVSRETGAAARERHLVTDQLGSVTVALDGQGALLGYRDYYPYGSVSIALDVGSPPRGPDLGFSGKEHDAETSLSYFGGRYYQPGWGRWLTPDPLGEIDGPNLYEYVGDNPTTLIDPHGLVKKDRKAARDANRRMGLDARGHGRMRRRRPVVRLDPDPSQVRRVQFTFMGQNRLGLHPGGQYTHRVRIVYTGTNAGDFAAANAAVGLLATPAGRVWHHYHNYNPATNSGTLYLMRVADHRRYHTGGEWMYRRSHGGAGY